MRGVSVIKLEELNQKLSEVPDYSEIVANYQDEYKSSLGYLENIPNYNGSFIKNSISKNLNKSIEDLNKKREEKELREIRSLEINEEILELNKFTNFLLQSVNKNQKEMLEGIQSLIDTISIDDKIKEANLSLIQEELINLRESTDNLNQGFVDLIKVKMTEMGVETAIKYLLIGLKTLFLNN